MIDKTKINKSNLILSARIFPLTMYLFAYSAISMGTFWAILGDYFFGIVSLIMAGIFSPIAAGIVRNVFYIELTGNGVLFSSIMHSCLIKYNDVTIKSFGILGYLFPFAWVGTRAKNTRCGLNFINGVLIPSAKLANISVAVDALEYYKMVNPAYSVADDLYIYLSATCVIKVRRPKPWEPGTKKKTDLHP